MLDVKSTPQRCRVCRKHTGPEQSHWGCRPVSPWALPCLGRPLWSVVAEILEPQAQVCSSPSLGGGPHTPDLRAGVSPAGQHGCRKALPTQSLGATPPGWVSGSVPKPALLGSRHPVPDCALQALLLQALLLPSLDNPHLLGQAASPHSPRLLLPGPALPGPSPPLCTRDSDPGPRPGHWGRFRARVWGCPEGLVLARWARNKILAGETQVTHPPARQEGLCCTVLSL